MLEEIGSSREYWLAETETETQSLVCSTNFSFHAAFSLLSCSSMLADGENSKISILFTRCPDKR